MSLFLFRFWPVLVPLLVYWLWLLLVRRRAVKEGKPKPRFSDGPWFWAVLCSLAVGLLCFLYLGMSAQGTTGDYTPPQFKDGKIVPGTVSP